MSNKAKREPESVVEGIAAEREAASVPSNPNNIAEPDMTMQGNDLLDSTLEKQVTQLGRKTAELLRQGKKVMAFIPVDKLNRDDKSVVVGINGWNFQIQREQWVNLPVPVVELLQMGGYQPTIRLS